MIDFPQIITGTIVIILFFIIGALSLKPRPKYPYFSRETLLSKAELKFYNILKAVTQPSQAISCKVRLADIINCSEMDWKRGYGHKISSKHIDFVLFDTETTDILLCIELDDSSHALPNRKKRDFFVDKSLKSANIPILRIKVARGYDLVHVQKEIKIALS